jgi:REP element-mobilizing transposase RayT
VLATKEVFSAFQCAVQRLEKWDIAAAVVMPNHVHILAAPHERDEKVGNLTGALKRWMRAPSVVKGSDWNWQAGSFDRLLRAEESAQEKWGYIRENPVRKGLVARWRDWPYRMGFDES